jgi:FAD/FMN-containing dehydrogenase
MNDGMDLLDCTSLNRILDFEWETGRVRLEAGVNFADLLEVSVPRGWFLPVTPGTKFVTVGGAIANDVHGKNHHCAGTIGSHVEQIMVFRSDGAEVLCSLTSNPELFRATIGGLGLTGVIAWADLRLKRIAGNAIEVETIPFDSLDQFLSLSRASDKAWEYTVAWLDCLSSGGTRGIFLRGNHAAKTVIHRARAMSIPFALPPVVLNRATASVFNRLYYTLKARKKGPSLIHYEQFFYPLDSLENWNLLYGRRGFVQYQCVLPHREESAVKRILETVSIPGQACFFAVLKTFGDIKSPGLLSFPRPGVTLALDFPMHGTSTLKLLDALDELVSANGGAVYPAKDARMSSAMFKASFPNWKAFLPFIDPKLSSSFWRRVTSE